MSNYGIKYGILGGIGIIVYMLLFYIVDKAMMLSPWIYWSGVIVYIVAMFSGIFAYKKANDGLITAEEGIRTAFTTFLVANAIFYLFYLFLFNIFAPELPVLQKTMSLDLLETTKDWYPEEQFDTMLEEMKTSDFKVTLAGSLFGFAKGAIGGFILAFIMARLIRNK